MSQEKESKGAGLVGSIIKLFIIGILIWLVRTTNVGQYIREIIGFLTGWMPKDNTNFKVSVKLIIPSLVALFIFYVIFRNIRRSSLKKRAALASIDGDKDKALKLYMELADSWNFSQTHPTPNTYDKQLKELTDYMNEIKDLVKDDDVNYPDEITKALETMNSVISPKTGGVISTMLSSDEMEILNQNLKLFWEKKAQLFSDIKVRFEK